MFCPQCGTKLKDGAKFCTECGASLQPVIDAVAKKDGAVSDGIAEQAQQEEQVQPAEYEQQYQAEQEQIESAAPNTQNAQRATLGSFLMQTRQVGRFAVPTFVAIIAAFVITAGVAYAAVRVVTEIIIPAIEQAQNSDSTSVEGAASDEETSQTIQEATGSPENIFQVAEILAMDPMEIPDFFTAQGMTWYDSNEALPSGTMSYWNAGNGAVGVDDGATYAFESDLKDASLYDYSEWGYTELSLGSSLISEFEDGANVSEAAESDLSTPTSLEAGTKANDICINTLNLIELTDDNISSLAAFCGISGSLENFRYESSGETSYSSYISGTKTVSAWCTQVLIDEEVHYWFAVQTIDDGDYYASYAYSSIGCVSEDTALEAIKFNLSEYGSLDSVTASEKAQLFAKALVQNGFSGLWERTNIETGKNEIKSSLVGQGITSDAVVNENVSGDWVPGHRDMDAGMYVAD